MTYAEQLAQDWRQEAEQLKEQILRWKEGNMHFSSNGVDTTPEFIQMMERTLCNLEKGIDMLEGKASG